MRACPPRQRWILVGLALGVLTLTLSACLDPVPLIATPTPVSTRPAPASLTIVVAESFLPAARAAASAYQRAFPEIQMTVIRRTHAEAMDRVMMGDADAAVVAWLPDPVPDEAWVTPVARDGLAIVVHPQNGLSGMTMAQLQELFQGQVQDLANWGGLPGAPQPVSREDASGEFAFFQAWVMRDARVTLNALLAPSSATMLDLVAEHPHGVGYVSTAWVDGRVRAVTVAGVPPAQETIAGNLYPLTRTFVVATRGEPQGATRDFVQWLLDAEGQAVVARHGFVRRPD
jgi:phosphate transport system substrate-binding protein